MNHPIPAPRRPVDTRPAPTGTVFTPAPPRPVVTSGPACVSCTHRTCRAQRARTLPRLGGHRAEFALEHHQAATLQARHRGLITWFGEATQSFWVASATGMYEAKTYDDLLAHLWARSQSRLRPREFWTRH
ncbi:hypothetical protein [Nocardiopsis alkaliphila]|uniref:hypothetical protein n=1 Tax=Nocardiopsis alkaliphila TaxID=225762 RepID=UPI0005270113|nr:hypothetical protein [Nocardiopsis alkaliphila]